MEGLCKAYRSGWSKVTYQEYTAYLRIPPLVTPLLYSRSQEVGTWQSNPGSPPTQTKDRRKTSINHLASIPMWPNMALV